MQPPQNTLSAKHRAPQHHLQPNTASSLPAQGHGMLPPTTARKPNSESSVRVAATTRPSTLTGCSPPTQPVNNRHRPNLGEAKLRNAQLKKRQPTLPSISTLAHMAPHSPAVSCPTIAAPSRLSSASMRGSPGAQKMPSSYYTARIPPSVVRTPRPPDATMRTTRPKNTEVYQNPAATATATAAHPTTPGTPIAYYVVGCAVLNPQLMISPSVQEEVRGVPSLNVVPDTLLRPGFGPQFNDTHGVPTTASTAGDEAQRRSGSPDRARALSAAWSSSPGGAPRQSHGQTTSPTRTVPTSLVRAADGAVVAIEAIHSCPVRNENIPLLQQTMEASSDSSLCLLRRLYQATTDDVIEPAHANPRNGTLETPRLQYHLAKELLAELTGAEEQLKTLASARRQVDWDVNIPTADTIPPPVIAFTTAHNGAPVSTVHSIRFRVDTHTLLMQREYTTEPVVSPTGARPRTAKSAVVQEDEGIGCEITREDRIGSSGLYCVHRLVGLLPGLGEKVGLERVLEYNVVTSANEMFMMPPYINAWTGDLFMELNTSRQGTVQLTITGVDCGSVDPATGVLQNSSNTLTCLLVFKHSSTTAVSGSTRDNAHKATGSGGPYYAQVPSLSARLDRTVTAGTVASAVVSVSRPAGSRSNAETQEADGCALALADFSRESSTGRSNRVTSPTKDGVATGARHEKHTAPQRSQQYNVGMQCAVPRHAAVVSTPERPTRTESETGMTISAAYRSAAYNPTADLADHSPCAPEDAGGKKANNRRPPQYYIFPGTNPHELRYDGYKESTRLRRLRQLKHQNDVKKTEHKTVAEQRPQPLHAEQTTEEGETKRNETRAAGSDNEKLPLTISHDGAEICCNTTDGKPNFEKELGTKGPDSTSVTTSLEPHLENSSPDHGSAGNDGRKPGTTTENDSVLCADPTTNRELRGSPLPTTFFFMDGVQSPLSYLRLTEWQDRLITLVREDDQDLLHRETRTSFRREAFQELSEGAMAGMFANLYLCNGGFGPSNVGVTRRTSISARRGSSTAALRNFGSGTDNVAAQGNISISNPSTYLANRNSAAANGSTAGGGGVQMTASATSSADKTFTMLRRLILCLALEEERASTQLYNDTVELCRQFCHSALLKTTALTRGTRDGLQQAAAAVLSSGLPISPGRSQASSYRYDSVAALSTKDMELLRTLSDALELSMTTTMMIGAYSEAVEYALQRVHTLCLLEGDTGTLVNAAQRDLAETYLLYGDYPTAATVAEDVVMVTRQILRDASDEREVIEAEMLCTLALAAAGRLERLQQYIDTLEINILPLESGGYSAARNTQTLLQAKLRLVLVFAKTYLARSSSLRSAGNALAATLPNNSSRDRVQPNERAANTAASLGTDDVVTLLREAVQLLRGGEDVQDTGHKLHPTVLPQGKQLDTHSRKGTAASSMPHTGGSRYNASAIISSPPRTLRALGNSNILSGDGSSTENSRDLGATMEAAEKRLRWNLLCFAGVQLIQNDQNQEGIRVMENTVKELVLSQKRAEDRKQCAALAAVLWVGLTLSKSRMQPEQATEIIPMLKEMSDRVVRTRGPLHPLAAMSNLLYAYTSHYMTNSRSSVNLATRSIAALGRGAGPNSYDLLTAHYVVGSMAQAQKRWRPALEHFSAAYAIAQTTRLADDDMFLMDTQFLGALLLCPPTAVLDLDTTTFCANVEERLQRLRQRVGPHSEKLVEPLWNAAELLFMLKDTNSAIKCVQQAVRLLDRRGVLLVSTAVLKPIDVLMREQQETLGSGAAQVADSRKRGEYLVAQRNAVVQTSFETISQSLNLATTLFMWAAMLESQACTTEAQEMYNQSLALYEVANLGDNTIAALRIMEALSKLLYTAGMCGDALMWASKAEELLHKYYRKEWPLEHVAVRKIVDAVEHRLFVEEGTHIVQSKLSTHSEVVELL